MARYIVFRTGSNAANQHLTERMVVGLHETPKRLSAGPDYRDAVDSWADTHPEVTVYNNQHLSLGTWSKWGPQAQDAALEAAAE